MGGTIENINAVMKVQAPLGSTMIQAEELRPLAAIIADLSKNINPQRLKTLKKAGQELTYIPWYQAVRYLDKFAPGWTSEIVKIESVTATIYPKDKDVGKLQTSVIMTVRISIPCAEGVVYREASALEVIGTAGYGDAATNAESAALRRTAAKFGLGLYLYDK